MRGRAREFAGFAVIGVGVIFAALPFVPGGLMLIAAGVALVGADHPRLRPHVVRLKLLRRTTMRWKQRKVCEMRSVVTATVEAGARQKWIETGIVLLVGAVMIVAALPFG